jgi:hypothetical protein
MVENGINVDKLELNKLLMVLRVKNSPLRDNINLELTNYICCFYFTIFNTAKYVQLLTFRILSIVLSSI